MMTARCRASILAWLLAMAPAATCCAQKMDDGPPAESSIWSASELSQWEIGVEITSQAPARNLTVTFPIPKDWPEQTIHRLEERTAGQVNRLKYNDLPPGATMASARVALVTPDQPVTIVVLATVEKRFHAVPNEAASLSFFERAPPGTEAFLSPSPYIESNHIRIRQLSESIPVATDAPAWEQVETIYDTLRERFPYEFDPEIRTCLEAIDQGHGDCEELSSLFIAVCRSRGIPARAVWVVDHTYPEFALRDASGEVRWIPVQMAGTRHFGDMPESRIILQKGDRFRVPGNRQATRYAQPTLVGGDAGAGIGLRFFCRLVE